MARYNLVDIGFNDFTIDEKRYSLMLMDMAMKHLHEENKRIVSFEPNDIYYEDGIFIFGKVADISPLVANDRNSAIIEDLVGLADLAFCAYLPAYNIKEGLLHPLAVHNRFEDFTKIFNDIDLGYYRSILVDAYENRKLPDTPYYYDYVRKAETSNNKEASMSLLKATEAGKLMADNNTEAAFSNVFLLVTVAACLVVEFIGVAIYYLNK